MAARRSLTVATLIFTFILYTIECTPKCEVVDQSEEEIVCTPRNAEYILIRGLVSDNNVTTRVTLRECRIIDVDFESFNKMTSLKYIDLSKNSIKYLKLGVLDGARQVNYLNLSYNMLTNFPLGLFDQKQKLEVLDLRSNAINSLELGIFDPLKKLKHLDLSDNNLIGGELNRYIFDQNPHIKFLDFSRNDMNEAPDKLLGALTMIDFLNLDRCQLNKVPKFATRRNLATMRHLILSTNLISELNDSTTFINLDNLEILNLAYNSIQNIHEDIFKSLKKLKMIILKNNKLTSLPDTLFQNLRKIAVIHLEDNLLETVSVNTFRGTGLKTLNLSHNRITHLVDNFCLELKNSGSILIKFYFNNNPWQCACLRDILKEVKSLNIQYNSNELNGRNPVCVSDAEFVCKQDDSLNSHFIEMYEKAIIGA